MKIRSISALTHALVALSGVALLSCQTYDFEPVQPLAIAQTSDHEVIVSRKAKPNIMLVVDKSGSMNDPVGSGTRLSEMKEAMNTFLTKYGDTARLGLSAFPFATGSGVDVACVQGKVLTDIVQSDDDDTELQAAASSINDTIQSIGSGSLPAVGGTPTAATLAEVAKLATLQDPDRDDFVLLLTDGLPNCNAALDPDTCTCVVNKTPCDYDLNCLDQVQVLASIDALRQKEIRVIVVGFGADTGASIALPVLNAMAEHGGFARKCETAADCGGTDTCDQVGSEKLCSTRFYQAANAAELADALAKIQSIVGSENPCDFKLSATPTSEELLAVYVSDSKVAPGADTWKYENRSGVGHVIFQGAMCNDLLNATSLKPFDLQIRVVETL